MSDAPRRTLAETWASIVADARELAEKSRPKDKTEPKEPERGNAA